MMAMAMRMKSAGMKPAAQRMASMAPSLCAFEPAM
jgi:hypothetical protein